MRKFELLKLEVCTPCHNDCADCAHGMLRKATPKFHLSLEQLKRFVKITEASEYIFDTLMIHGGGEPLLWKCLNQGLRYLGESTSFNIIQLTTNGRELHRVEDDTWNFIDEVNVSVYEDDQKFFQ